MANDLDDDTRLKLIGLKALADGHNSKLRDIYRVALELTGVGTEEKDPGTVSDYIYGEGMSDVEALLELAERNAKDAA